ncbi:unnamed protein product [Auanema sp. JU1783]|nr:unnamed protein product [Auanema sp. JU1783]
MRYFIICLLISICVANLVEDPKFLPQNKHHHVRRHSQHLKYQRDLRMNCGFGQCPDDGFFVYYKCCRSRSDQCCWYLRMWVIVVFGVILLKAFLACFVSFFRCVCC